MYKVIKYSSQYFNLWNKFIENSKNGTFLFHRNFMEYHKDRFEDFSLMVFKKETLVAVLPANRVGDKLYSHQGLTYGGVVFSFKTKFLDSIEIINTIIDFTKLNEISEFIVKMMPTYYHKAPSDELDYYMHRANARLIKKDVAMVIDYNNEIGFQKNRKEGINKALRHNVEIREDQDFDIFWKSILIPNLEQKHGAKPVHKIDEIQKLHNFFPNNIKQINAYDFNGNIVAGTTVFLTDNVVHPQYVSGGKTKNATGAIDLLYNFIINGYKEGRKYFNFNTSSEKDSNLLNEGLIYWKESCGARAFTVDTYRLLTNSQVKIELK